MNGIRKLVSRQRAILMRLGDNASRGQTRAIQLVLEYQQRIVEPILAAELEQASKNGKFYTKSFTLMEMRVLEYLLCKAEGKTYTGDPTPFVEMLKDRPKFQFGVSGQTEKTDEAVRDQ